MPTHKDAQKANAEALQEQIDRLIQGKTGDIDAGPTSLREFLEKKMAEDSTPPSDRTEPLSKDAAGKEGNQKKSGKASPL